MSEKSLAIIGLGGIGNRHAGSIAKATGARLVAGVDCDPAKRELFAQQYGVKCYDSVEALLSEQKPDGVIVSTPPSEREALLRPLLAAGCSVLSEKPLAHDLPSATRLRELVAQYPDAKVFVGFCHRFLGAATAAREIISRGELGSVIWMNIVFASNSPEMKDRWMTDPTLSGGGAAMDNAGHALDLFRFLLDQEIEVNGFYRNEWSGRGEDSFSLSVRGGSGALGSILGSYLASTPRLFWEICGSSATLRFDYAAGGAELWKVFADGTLEAIDVSPAGNRFAAQITEWVRAMNGEPVSMASVEDGFVIAKIMDQLGGAA